MLIASALSSIQTALVVGHELGHFLLEHLNIDGGASAIELNVLGQDAYDFKDLHEMEFAADRRGAEMIIDHFGKIYDPLFGYNEAAYSQAGIDILFSFFEFIRVVADAPSETNTHPASTVRREKLREYMWQRTPEAAIKLAKSAEVVVNSFITQK